MSAEDTMRSDRTPKDHRLVLSDLRDNAILLTMATDYLCEKPVLERIGFEVEQKIGDLDFFVEGLKKRFVGIPTREMDVGEHFEALRNIANRLQDAGEEVCRDCRVGKLGKKLGEGIESLSAAIDQLRDRVEGRDISYSAADSVLGVFGRVRALFQTPAGQYRLALRILGLLLFACLVAFVYLWTTMPSVDDLARQVEQERVEIQALKTKSSELEGKLGELKKKYELLTRKVRLTRQETVAVLDLNVRIHKLREEMDKLQADLGLKRESLEQDLGRLERLREKTYLDRLLRR